MKRTAHTWFATLTGILALGLGCSGVPQVNPTGTGGTNAGGGPTGGSVGTGGTHAGGAPTGGTVGTGGHTGGASTSGGSNVTGGTATTGGSSSAIGGSGNDSSLHCPVGCVIDSCQSSCVADASHDTSSSDGLTVEYRGQVTVSRNAGDTSIIRCATAFEQLNCGSCWGTFDMDVQMPRVWFWVENAVVGGTVVHRVHVRFSWNGRDASGYVVAPITFTLILMRFDFRVLDPDTSAVLGTAQLSLNSLGMNPDPNVLACNTEAPAGDPQQRYRAFDIDVPLPATSNTSDIIEFTTLGNYE